MFEAVFWVKMNTSFAILLGALDHKKADSFARCEENSIKKQGKTNMIIVLG